MHSSVHKFVYSLCGNCVPEPLRHVMEHLVVRLSRRLHILNVDYLALSLNLNGINCPISACAAILLGGAHLIASDEWTAHGDGVMKPYGNCVSLRMLFGIDVPNGSLRLSLCFGESR